MQAASGALLVIDTLVVPGLGQLRVFGTTAHLIVFLRLLVSTRHLRFSKV
jgi:hypothetical protein